MIDQSDYKTGSSEISYRISCASFKFKQLKHIFTNRKINMKVRIIFYNAYVRSRLCYGCPLWNLSQQLRNKVKSAHMKHLRSIVKGGFSRVGGPRSQQDEVGYNWKFFYDYEDLLRICRTDPVLNFADFQRSKWISHVIRKGNDSVIKQLMFEVSQTNRKGHTTSFLDQMLQTTRSYDMTDNFVFSSSVSKNFVKELKIREVEFLPRHHGNSEDGNSQESFVQ